MLNGRSTYVTINLLKAALVIYLKEYLTAKEIRSGLIAFDLSSREQGLWDQCTVKASYEDIQRTLRVCNRVLKKDIYVAWM